MNLQNVGNSQAAVITLAATSKDLGNLTLWGGQGGTTVNLNGSLQVGGFNGTQTAFGQNQVNIRYSSCALNRTMDATGFATPVRSRSWVRLM